MRTGWGIPASRTVRPEAPSVATCLAPLRLDTAAAEGGVPVRHSLPPVERRGGQGLSSSRAPNGVRRSRANCGTGSLETPVAPDGRTDEGQGGGKRELPKHWRNLERKGKGKALWRRRSRQRNQRPLTSAAFSQLLLLVLLLLLLQL